MKKRYLLLLVYTITVLFINSCGEYTSEPTNIAERGKLVSSTFNESYSVPAINFILTFFNAPEVVAPKYEVEHYKIVYKTIDKKGNIVIASGALFYPKKSGALPSVALMHGTETKRDNVASSNIYASAEGVTGLIMASMGYACIVPDYLGLGDSDMIHPYIIAEASYECAVDMLRAAKAFKNTIDYRNNPFFIAGYSEGGYAAYALHKGIQMNYNSEFNITASAPMAGPYNIDLTMDLIFNDNIPGRTIYLAYIIYAYNDYYEWNRLDEMFKSQYNKTVKEVFDGKKSFSEASAMLPSHYSDLFSEKFVADIRNRNAKYLLDAVNANTLIDWIPDAPVMFIHGSDDIDVPVENTYSVYNKLISSGKNNVYIKIYDGLTHTSAGVPALGDAIVFFESFLQ